MRAEMDVFLLRSVPPVTDALLTGRMRAEVAVTRIVLVYPIRATAAGKERHV